MLFCSGKITILEQTQGRKRKVYSHTAPRAGCPRCCRLWADVWPRRAEVGYGYHPAYLGACWGAFRCAESEAGERAGDKAPRLEPLLPAVRAVFGFLGWGQNSALRGGLDPINRKIPV